MLHYAIYILGFIVVVGLVIFIPSCYQFGGNPSNEDEVRFKKSPQYIASQDKFENAIHGLSEKMWERNTFSIGMIYKWLFADNGRTPKTELPNEKPDVKEFISKKDSISFIWFGHSTILLNFYGKIILFDPVFSSYASPFWFTNKRFQPPALKLEELPKLDYVIITHDHYDHLDKNTIDFYKTKNVKIFTTIGVEIHLKKWDVPDSLITTFDWWDSLILDDIEIIAAPAQHFSGRGIFDRQQTLWASYILKSNGKTIYFSGDTGYSDHLKQIGDKYGPIDLAFIETGQYNEDWREVHLMPYEWSKAYNDLQAKRYFPIHWGMFSLSFDPWYRPIIDVIQESEKNDFNLITSKLGQIDTIGSEKNNIQMWKNFIKKYLKSEKADIKEV